MADERDAYNAITGQCAAVMNALGFTASAYLVDRSDTTITAKQSVVLVKPGRSQLRFGQSGVGLVSCRFQTILWWRNVLDYADRGTYRIGGDDGCLQAMWALRYGITGASPVPGLVGSFLFSQDISVVEPVLLEDGGGPEGVPDMAGWLRVTDSYKFSIPFDWTSDGE